MGFQIFFKYDLLREWTHTPAAIYVYIYMYIYMFIYVYIYIYMNMFSIYRVSLNVYYNIVCLSDTPPYLVYMTYVASVLLRDPAGAVWDQVT